MHTKSNILHPCMQVNAWYQQVLWRTVYYQEQMKLRHKKEKEKEKERRNFWTKNNKKSQRIKRDWILWFRILCFCNPIHFTLQHTDIGYK